MKHYGLFFFCFFLKNTVEESWKLQSSKTRLKQNIRRFQRRRNILPCSHCLKSMGFITTCAACLVLSLLARVDDVSSRPTGSRRDVERSLTMAAPQSLQREEQGSRPGPVPPGSERVPSAGDLRNL